MAPPLGNNEGSIGRAVRRRALLSGAGGAALAAFGVSACSRVPEEGKVEGGDLLDRLRDGGTVRIGVAGEVPFGYIDENGEVTGEAPEIAKVIFPRLGVPKVKAVPTKFGALIPGLTQARQFDVVSAGMYINPTRCEQVLFSDPDYLMLDSFIVKKGNPHGIKTYEDIAEKGLKLASGTAYAEIDYAKAAGVKDVLVLPDQVAGLDAVAQGRVDAFAGTNVTVRTVVKGSARAEATEPFQPEVDGKPAYGAGGFAFRLSEKNLRDAFNKELHKLKESGELLRIVKPFGFTEDEMTDLTLEKLCPPAKGASS
ncbi:MULTISPECIES: ectoine/hydroxyectoine ABC transporter substrate-binding protein EhuB [unclassified Streptomyces]|uniref:ectoine/hydroxyectoine ABC transporter substrate-binding protein EhuB n=1 Tax=unclassified Streptomyces TaxID=2593676 RepID=UPI0007465BD5|nr:MULTISPECIES: ectoine/hydroxyectoine ABC transporter substrate-binding protein EhuB [unclassified Streptomyces]KUL52151.1 amino acid ABC transporter substrate-binding protein [Streptomyces sp. NRRL S-1521]THC48118.1 ectoine/hydroxyectoine ABC transporter substrate-binding protein EhuB [Streptomyces sp. A1499]